MDKFLISLLGGLAVGTLLSAFSPSAKAPQTEPLLSQPVEPPAKQTQDPVAANQPSRAPDHKTAQVQNRKAEISGPSAGIAGTFLTGTQGVDPNQLSLGRNTLLGG